MRYSGFSTSAAVATVRTTSTNFIMGSRIEEVQSDDLVGPIGGRRKVHYR